MYTCPMHPEIITNHPSTCPKCGMNLVFKDTLIKVHKTEDAGLVNLTWKSYTPLMAILTVLLLATIAISINDLKSGTFLLDKTISYFMIGFFLTFATFKLMDLKGFANGYRTYDILAKKVPVYGYIYPFIELSFGLAMIVLPFSKGVLFVECIVMALSGLGVAIKIARKEEYICACLGTFLKVPLTKITLIEDFGMVLLALIIIL